MLLAISVCYWSMIKIYCGMVCFLRFLWEKKLLCLFGYIWVKRQFPLISPLANFNEILIHNLCRRERIINGRKTWCIITINFAKDSKLSGRSFIYAKKSKGPNIEPCGTRARSGNQTANCLKFQQSRVCIVIPRARPYQRLLRYIRS